MAVSTSEIRVIFFLFEVFSYTMSFSFRTLLRRTHADFHSSTFLFPLFFFFAFVGSSFGMRSNGLYDLLRRCFVLLYLKIVCAFKQQLHALLSALILILFSFSLSLSLCVSLFLSSFAAGSHFQFRLMALSYEPDIPISISMI